MDCNSSLKQVPSPNACSVPSDSANVQSSPPQSPKQAVASVAKLVTVKLTTIDELKKRYGLYNIDYVKLDIEGYEIEALNGYSSIDVNTTVVVESHMNLDLVLYKLFLLKFNNENIKISPIDGNCSIVHAVYKQRHNFVKSRIYFKTDHEKNKSMFIRYKSHD